MTWVDTPPESLADEDWDWLSKANQASPQALATVVPVQPSSAGLADYFGSSVRGKLRGDAGKPRLLLKYCAVVLDNKEVSFCVQRSSN